MNIPEYAIVIFPKYDNQFLIDQQRNQFDPLVSVLDPHHTLVFSFESDLSLEQLQAHIQLVIQGILPIEIQLQRNTGSEGEYLFSNLKHGNNQIIEMHDRLYTGLNESHLIRDHTYIPHLTVGRLNNKAEFLTALEYMQKMNAVFDTVINDLALVHVGGNFPIEVVFNPGKGS
jgi:2'-5' RNA ligase